MISRKTSGLAAGVVGVAALVASSCPPARLECGPGSEVFRTVDTIQRGDTFLRISTLDSIRCEGFGVSLEEPALEDSAAALDTVAASLEIRRVP